MPKIVESTSREFIWPAPDLNRLRTVFSAVINVDAYFFGTVTTEGAVQREGKYDTLADWLAGLNPDIDRAHASFTTHTQSRLTLWWHPRDALVRLSADIEKLAGNLDPSGVDVIDKIAADLGLVARNERRAERLFTPAAGDLTWVTPVIALAKQLTGASPRFRGRWSTGDTHREVTVESEWLQALGQLRDWDAFWDGQGNSVHLSYHKHYEEVHIALRSYDQAALTRALDGLTNLAGLKPRPLDPQLQGEARHYYLSDKATEAWYVNALELIRGFVDTSFWGNVTCEGDASTQRGFGNPSEWWTELREGLAKDDVITSFVSYSGYRRRLFFDLDHLRQVLSLDIQSFGGDDVAETHQRFATELGLKPAPPDRYRYRKWGQLFDIRWESPEALADAIDAALGTLFKGGRVALPEATLHMGDGEEEVQAFSTLPAFLKYLREEAKNLTEVHLVAEGPRGEAIGVHVDKQLTRMMLHASTASFKAFTAFKKTLKGGLAEMKPKPSDSLQESAAAPESGESPKPSGWVVSIALGLFALAGALLGTEFYKAIRESAKLVILLPPGKNGEFETTSKNVLVRWTYNTPHALGRETQDALHRTWVEASRIPDGTPVIPREQHSGSVQLTNLAPGSYCVLLIAEDATASLIVNVLPAAPQQPATNKPGSK